MRKDANYDQLVKELAQHFEMEKQLKEKIKAAESQKLSVFTSVFEKSYKNNFKKIILDTDSKLLKEVAEKIVDQFEDIVKEVEQKSKGGDPKSTKKSSTPKTESTSKVQNDGDPELTQKDSTPKTESTSKIQNDEQPEMKKGLISEQITEDFLKSLASNPTEPVSHTDTENVQNVQTVQNQSGGITYTPQESNSSHFI